MKRITLIATLVTLIAVTAIAAPPQPQPGRGPAPAPQQGAPGDLLPPGALAEFLDLTEAQKSAIEGLRTTLQNTVEPLREQQRTNHEQLEAALAAGDAARAGQLAVANYKIAQQIRAAHEAFRTGFESLLTSEQKARLAIYHEIIELRRKAGPRD